MVDGGTSALFIAPMRLSSATTHVHITNLVFQSATVGPLGVIPTHRTDAYVCLVPFLPHTTHNALNITGFHGTGMPRLVGPICVAFTPLFRQLCVESFRIHYLLYKGADNTDLL